MNALGIFKIVKEMGPSWVIFRTNYEIKRKTGVLKRRFPTAILSDRDFLEKLLIGNIDSKESLARYVRGNREKFFVNGTKFGCFKEYLDAVLTEKDKERIIEIADNAVDGRILCFSRWTTDYGSPINWHANPISKYEWQRDIHWVDLEELSMSAGDVKYVWEASRFPQVFYFVRAYVLTNDDKYVEAFWRQVEHWIQENPYQLGINWKCGQEVSFRIFAWIFGLYAFLDSKHTTDERVLRLIKSIYYSAVRVENNIAFAIRAVQNNHAISEAACLFTVGNLFPFFKDSDRFLKKGIEFLEQEGLKQIYEDGSYIQHSMNYHRLMLQVYSWCLRLAEMNGVSYSSSLIKRLKRAIDFLYQMQDEVSGQVPNYGANDGALVFPLSSCGYLDYRPQLNTINYIINGERLYESGRHDEELFWFCGLEAVQSTSPNLITRESRKFHVGGYYTIRGKDSFGMIRCAKFKHRPGHSDMLHFDLWYRGINVLTDIGSYSYNPEEQYRGYFGATRNHNTITINDMNQSKKGPRFLTFDWPEGFLSEFRVGKDDVYFSGHHTAYGDIIHRRKIEYHDGTYVITDELENPNGKEIKINLNWNLGTSYQEIGDNKYVLLIDNEESVELEIMSTSPGFSKVCCGNEELPAGWRSLHYGEKTPLNQLQYVVTSSQNLETITSRATLPAVGEDVILRNAGDKFG